MSATLIRLADVAAQPWRNGGGLTRELLARPAGGDWQVRVSVAEIAADGPFSTFPGVQRWFVVLDGAGVALTVDGRVHERRRHEAPLRFSGSSATTCRLLAGPTRDLNLMVRGADGAMVPAAAGAAWAPQAKQCGLFAARSGTCRSGDTAVAVPSQALLWFALAPAALVFEPEHGDGVPGWWLAATPGGDRDQARP